MQGVQTPGIVLHLLWLDFSAGQLLCLSLNAFICTVNKCLLCTIYTPGLVELCVQQGTKKTQHYCTWPQRAHNVAKEMGITKSMHTNTYMTTSKDEDCGGGNRLLEVLSSRMCVLGREGRMMFISEIMFLPKKVSYVTFLRQKIGWVCSQLELTV